MSEPSTKTPITPTVNPRTLRKLFKLGLAILAGVVVFNVAFPMLAGLAPGDPAEQPGAPTPANAAPAAVAVPFDVLGGASRSVQFALSAGALQHHLTGSFAGTQMPAGVHTAHAGSSLLVVTALDADGTCAVGWRTAQVPEFPVIDQSGAACRDDSTALAFAQR
jgi:hypothetical protein